MAKPKPLESQTPNPRTTPFGSEINKLFMHSPLLAADKLIDAFLRPPRYKPTPAQQTILDKSHTTTISVSNITIKVYTWEPPPSATNTNPTHPKTILLTHGYNTSAASLTAFIAPLLALGHRVVAHDHTAHGLSGGEWGDLGVFKDTVVTLLRQHPPVEAVVAYSVGATMALVGLLEARGDVRVKSVVCLSAPTRLESVFRRFCWGVGVEGEVVGVARGRMEGRGIVLPDEIRSVGRGKEDVGRLLVVQDRGDRIVTMEDAEWLEANFARVRVEVTEGNGHYRGLSDPRVVKLVASFVREGMDGLPKL